MWKSNLMKINSYNLITISSVKMRRIAIRSIYQIAVRLSYRRFPNFFYSIRKLTLKNLWLNSIRTLLYIFFISDNNTPQHHRLRILCQISCLLLLLYTRLKNLYFLRLIRTIKKSIVIFSLVFKFLLLLFPPLLFFKVIFLKLTHLLW